LTALLQQTWTNAASQKIGIDGAAIDGNAWTEDVWDFARKHHSSQLIMVRGLGSARRSGCLTPASPATW
jgi:phage terminase large subunit GpA-like protein